MEQVAIFCDVDDFCKAYEEYCMHSLMMEKQKIIPRTRMALSEIMTILIMFHLSGYRTFKKCVTITVSEPIVCLVNMPKEGKVLWDGSMVSNCI